MFSSQNSQASSDVNYIDDVFSTWLYTGTGVGVTNTITNNINLSGKGGLTWLKCRNSAFNNILFDTARGDFELSSNTTAAQANNSRGFVPLSTGFSLNGGENTTNNTGNNYASWTFREQPKFFDVVTYTGNGSSITVPHSLGSAPGCIIVKRTNTTGDWPVYHRSVSDCGFLNYANAFTSAQRFSSVTSTNFTINVSTADVNASGSTYVAYLFAHDAGGFGLTGTDNVISCGSWTGTGATPGPVVTLGYEPQWVIWKRADAGTEQWHIRDVMRGMPVSASGQDLYADASTASGNTTNEGLIPTATGFQVIGTNTNANTNGGTYIYIAIRRPNKPPTTGTQVYTAASRDASPPNYQSGFPVDMGFTMDRVNGGNCNWASRLTGATRLVSSSTAAEASYTTAVWDYMDGYQNTGTTASSEILSWMFRRAPGFFDEVCYTGTGSTTAYSHSLGVAPELMIVKSRNDVNDWAVYSATLGNLANLRLNTTAASSTALNLWGSTTPSATTFTTNGTYNLVGGGTITYVAYLFATCAGVSKVGSYTGTGALQTVACGFTSGARFVLVKATSTTGDWYVWDSARGISSSTDPYLLLNSTAAEVTSTNWVDTDTTGFKLTAASGNLANTNGTSYIFLAIS